MSREALIYAHCRTSAFELAGQGARSAVDLMSMSDEQRLFPAAQEWVEGLSIPGCEGNASHSIR